MIDYQHQQHPHQPYAPQQPYPPQGQPQHPYQPQGQHPYQHPHPYAYPHPQPPAVPEEIGDVRRMLSAGVDGIITLVVGFGLAQRLADDKGVGIFWVYVVACLFGVSFVHHVLGPLLFRATVGKFLLVTRVVREADGGRPRFWQTVGRWLLGLTWLPMQPVLSLFGDDGDPYEDACGLRYVRSKDLR
ncbi:RDD family protein [Streptomyces netropsis]|uniref:RDD family protein n=1 Tax=Streptomyces netropsis TaxID=55404 RepID=UPI00379652EA